MLSHGEEGGRRSFVPSALAGAVGSVFTGRTFKEWSEADNTHFIARRDWILEEYLSEQGDYRLPNEHPVIQLNRPKQVASNSVEIRWKHKDAERDAATVDLFWTDMSFSSLAPIPGAQGLPAGKRGRGQFTWTKDLPDIEGRPIYVHAVILDDQSPLRGRATSKRVRPLKTRWGTPSRADPRRIVVIRSPPATWVL